MALSKWCWSEGNDDKIKREENEKKWLRGRDMRDEKLCYQTYRERVFIDRTASSGHNIRRIECPEHGCCLAGVDDKQKFIVPAKKYHSIAGHHDIHTEI